MAFVVVNATLVEVVESAGDQDKLSDIEILHRALGQNFFSDTTLTERLRYGCLRPIVSHAPTARVDKRAAPAKFMEY